MTSDLSHVQKKMEPEFERDSCVRGYHFYQAIWEAAVGVVYTRVQRESGNAEDRYAVDRTIIGHLPRKVLHVCSLS